MKKVIIIMLLSSCVVQPRYQSIYGYYLSEMEMYIRGGRNVYSHQQRSLILLTDSVVSVSKMYGNDMHVIIFDVKKVRCNKNKCVFYLVVNEYFILNRKNGDITVHKATENGGIAPSPHVQFLNTKNYEHNQR